MELDGPYRRDTPNDLASYDPGSSKRIRRIHFAILDWSINAVTLLVQNNHVYIYFMTIAIGQNKIMWPGYFQFYFSIAVRLEYVVEFRNVLSLNSYVEVFVRTSLSLE